MPRLAQTFNKEVIQAVVVGPPAPIASFARFVHRACLREPLHVCCCRTMCAQNSLPLPHHRRLRETPGTFDVDWDIRAQAIMVFCRVDTSSQSTRADRAGSV